MILYSKEKLTLKNNMKQQQFITIILAFTLILTIVWVGSSVYHSYVDSTIDIPLENSIKPIKGTFDKETIEQLKSRTNVEPLLDDSLVLTDSLLDETATPSVELEEEIATDSADFEEDEL